MSLDLNVPDDYQMSETEFEKLLAGNLLPAGIYSAQVTEVKEVEAKSGSSGIEFEFTVIGGAYHGEIIKDTLWATEAVEKVRKPIFMARMGLMIKGPDGKYVRNAAAKSWKDAIGAKVNIEVEIETYDKKGGGKGNKSKVTFGGLHPYDPSKAGPGGSAPGGASDVVPSGGPGGPGSGGFPGVPVAAGAVAASRYDTSDL